MNELVRVNKAYTALFIADTTKQNVRLFVDTIVNNLLDRPAPTDGSWKKFIGLPPHKFSVIDRAETDELARKRLTENKYDIVFVNNQIDNKPIGGGGLEQYRRLQPDAMFIPFLDLTQRKGVFNERTKQASTGRGLSILHEKKFYNGLYKSNVNIGSILVMIFYGGRSPEDAAFYYGLNDKRIEAAPFNLLPDEVAVASDKISEFMARLNREMNKAGQNDSGAAAMQQEYASASTVSAPQSVPQIQNAGYVPVSPQPVYQAAPQSAAQPAQPVQQQVAAPQPQVMGWHTNDSAPLILQGDKTDFVQQPMTGQDVVVVQPVGQQTDPQNNSHVQQNPQPAQQNQWGQQIGRQMPQSAREAVEQMRKHQQERPAQTAPSMQGFQQQMVSPETYAREIPAHGAAVPSNNSGMVSDGSMPNDIKAAEKDAFRFRDASEMDQRLAELDNLGYIPPKGSKEEADLLRGLNSKKKREQKRKWEKARKRNEKASQGTFFASDLGNDGSILPNTDNITSQQGVGSRPVGNEEYEGIGDGDATVFQQESQPASGSADGSVPPNDAHVNNAYNNQISETNDDIMAGRKELAQKVSEAQLELNRRGEENNALAVPGALYGRVVFADDRSVMVKLDKSLDQVGVSLPDIFNMPVVIPYTKFSHREDY